MLFLSKLNAAMLEELILSARNVCARTNLVNRGWICDGNSASEGERESLGGCLRMRYNPQELLAPLQPSPRPYTPWFSLKNLPETPQQN